MEPIDLSIVGELRLDSVDHIAEDIDDLTGGFVWAIGKGLLGDLGDVATYRMIFVCDNFIGNIVQNAV